MPNMQDSWTQFLYTRLNRPSGDSDSAPAPKRAKIRSTERHNYANVSIPEDDEEANRRNVASLKQEVHKGTTRLEAVKSLVRRTFPLRRRHILEDQPRVETLIENFPHLKKTSLVSFLLFVMCICHL